MARKLDYLRPPRVEVNIRHTPPPRPSLMRQTRCNISSCAFDRGDCGVGLTVALVAAGYVAPVPTKSMWVLTVSGIVVGISIGLFILRVVLAQKRKADEKRRGYTDAEMKGMDGAAEDEL